MNYYYFPTGVPPNRGDRGATGYQKGVSLDDASNISPLPERNSFSVSRRRLKNNEGGSSRKSKNNTKEGSDTQDGGGGGMQQKFGFSLRNRDQSSDSCESGKSFATANDNFSPRSKSNWSLNNRQSPGSSSSDTVHTPSPSPSALTQNTKKLPNSVPQLSSKVASSIPKFCSNKAYNDENVDKLSCNVELIGDVGDECAKTNSYSKPVANQSSGQGKQPRKLSADAAIKTSEKRQTAPDSSQAEQLVCELFDSLRSHTEPPSTDNGKVAKSFVPKFKPNTPHSTLSLKKIKPSAISADRTEDDSQISSSIDFKSKLRRTDLSKSSGNVLVASEDSHIVDFRSQLRRVAKDDKAGNKSVLKDTSQSSDLNSDFSDKNRFSEKKSNNEDRNSLDSIGNKRDSLNSDDDPKRFSSSSINNLKKLWEKEDKGEPIYSKGNENDTQSSPKYSAGIYQKPDKEAEKHSDNESASSNVNKIEKKTWPPKHDETVVKPVVPTKPNAVKNLRHPPPSGGAVKLPPPKPAGIYATPSFINQSNALSVSTKKDKSDGGKISKSFFEFKTNKSVSSKKDDSKKRNGCNNVPKAFSISKAHASSPSPTESSSSSSGNNATEHSRMLEETANIELTLVNSGLHKVFYQ